MAERIDPIISVSVNTGGAKGVSKSPLRANFDITAHNWPIVKSASPSIKPVFIENIINESGSFACCHLSKRKVHVSTAVKDGAELEAPYIVCTAIDDKRGVISKILSDNDFKDPNPSLQQPPNYTSSYKGPRWATSLMSYELEPPDASVLEGVSTVSSGSGSSSGSSGTTTATTTTASAEKLPTKYYAEQTEQEPGYWWGLESTEFVSEHMPFWVEIRREREPVTSDKYPNFILIQIGVGSNNHAYDLYLPSNGRAMLIDYDEVAPAPASSSGSSATPTAGTSTGTSAPGIARGTEYIAVPFDLDLATIWSSQQTIHVGFMTAAGALVAIVNGVPLVYRRINKNSGTDDYGTLEECKIVSTAVRVYGSSFPCLVNFSPMSFAPRGIMPLGVQKPPAQTTAGGTSVSVDWSGVDGDGNPGAGSVCKIPDSQGASIFGCDCKTFNGPGGSDSPAGFGFRKKGIINVEEYNDVLTMTMNAGEFDNGSKSMGTIKNGATPFYFRLKGGWEYSREFSYLVRRDVGDDVISASVTAEASDYHHIKRSANITLYNKDGTYDTFKGVSGQARVSFGGAFTSDAFQGVITNSSSSEVPGKETMTIHAEDYIYILKNTPIVNSPFYDGMEGFAAIKDLAERAGIKRVINNMNSSNDYFIRSGYGFTKPAMRFDSRQPIFDCIMNIVKIFEAFIYFDGDGRMIVEKVAGGIWGATGGGLGAALGAGSYSKAPTSSGSEIIIGEKRRESDFNSTATVISVLTIDRDTRNAIVHTESSTYSVIPFRKIHLINQPALGGIEEARLWAQELGERVFKPIRRVSFRTPGAVSGIQPLLIISVDGEQFRVRSYTTTYNAEDQSLVSDVNAEWLGA